MENFKKDIAELLEVDSVLETDELKNFDAWDSLTILSIIAYADEKYKITVSANELNSLRTIHELEALFSKKAHSK
jgi:acyl carrier protein